jgi:hypothetical protein
LAAIVALRKVTAGIDTANQEDNGSYIRQRGRLCRTDAANRLVSVV